MIEEGTYGQFKYLLYKPDHLRKTTDLPLIVVMHGSGEIGSSLSKLKKREPFISLNSGKFKANAHILMPQLPKDSWGKMAAEVKKLIDYFANQLDSDKERISLTGHSLGAMGVIELMLKYPNSFSAGASLSSAKNYKAELPKIAHVPLYFLCGEQEHNYKKYAQEMFAVMNGLNEESKLTIVKGSGHAIQPTWVNSKYGIFDWLMQFKIGDVKYPAWWQWLDGMGLLDGKGNLTDKADEPIPDDMAKQLKIKMAKVG